MMLTCPSITPPQPRDATPRQEEEDNVSKLCGGSPTAIAPTKLQTQTTKHQTKCSRVDERINDMHVKF
jgi:hypothetical protein